MGPLFLKKGSVTSGGLTKTDPLTYIREEKLTIHCQCRAAHRGSHTRNQTPLTDGQKVLHGPGRESGKPGNATAC